MNSKAAFALQLYEEYEIVVNIDADHIITARLDEILIGDYDVGVAAAFSNFRNGACSIKSMVVEANGRVNSHREHAFCPPQSYIEAGLIAGRKYFWDIMQWNSLIHAHEMVHKEQDVLNIIIKFIPFNVKILDGHTDPNHPAHKMWYGTAIMGREMGAILQDDKILLNNKPIKTIHFSKLRYPKDHPRSLFSASVCDFIYSKIVIGRYGNHPCIDLLKSNKNGIYIY